VTPRQRLVFFGVAMAGLVACFLWAVGGLPGFGNYPGPYGFAILRVAVAQTHATGVVSAVNFSYRGFDTVGEEFILFTAAAGLSVVLRRLRGEHERERGEHEQQREQESGGSGGPAGTSDNSNMLGTSPAVRLPALLLAGPTVLVGWWLASHAQTNPSGGFQGGAMLATALVLVYLAGEFLTFRRLSPVAVLDAVEAIGAGGFAAIGVIALAMGLPYLYNFMPLGQFPGAVSSGGVIPLISFFVGLEVAAAFAAIIGEFLEQTLLVRSR
jgi:multicomponent Na+:H+ antiporter subunit B